MKRKIKGKNYYALLCHSGENYWDALICAVESSKKEAEEVNKEINCLARHTIKKCDIEISF